MDERTFEDADGIEIFYRRWSPVSDARAIVVIVHGASEHSGRYERVAGMLSRNGYAVYALDQRGHGRTADATGRGQIGPGGADALVDDVHELVIRAGADFPGTLVIVFGHSMGSLVALAYVERHGDEVAGCVLSGTMGPMPPEMATSMREAVEAGGGAEPVDVLAPFNAGFEPARTSYDWLSRDDVEVDRYIADPLCGDDLPLTADFVAQTLTMIADVMEPAALERIRTGMPVLLLTGDDDPVSNGGAQVRELERRLREVGLTVTAVYYPGARHEVLNETNRDEVDDDIIEWLTQVEASTTPQR